MAESLLEEYEKFPEKRPTDPAKRILYEVLHNVFRSVGLSSQWSNTDDSAKERLLRTNLEIVEAHLVWYPE